MGTGEHAPADGETGGASGVSGAVVVASSTGGLDALSDVLSGLPAGYPATTLVVQHLDPRHASRLTEILDRRTPLMVRWATDGERVAPSTVYVAPPDHHIRVGGNGTITLSRDVPVHFVRPSADVLFRSAADAFGRHTVAVILTGKGRDGSEGARAVKNAGGTVIAQDRATSLAYDMPRAAIEDGVVDRVLPLHEIPPALASLLGKEVG
jgi:two-component system chemotaxis response regulator CheB